MIPNRPRQARRNPARRPGRTLSDRERARTRRSPCRSCTWPRAWRPGRDCAP